MSLMNNDNNSSVANNHNSHKDDAEEDMVMPGFRFHPTEEELVDFYLRRKVEGKRFNVELITFLDLYRYDPWELPALAAIGEKEWFFYVPRDRKYRNGDRPNRVTTSGYWKATGADRMIKTETSRSIGLKKTLVFYSGKAPKGIRTSWIMNEYRLPQHETEKYQKAEISLCRVYKRPGVEDHPSVPRSLPSRASSSRVPQTDKKTGQPYITNIEREKFSTETDGSCSSSDVTTGLGLSKTSVYNPIQPSTTSIGLINPTTEEDIYLNQSRQAYSLIPNFHTNSFASDSSSVSSNSVDDLHRFVNYQQACISHQQPAPPSQFGIMAPQLQPLAFNALPNLLPTTFSERLWEWNPVQEESRDQYNVESPFK